MKLDTFCQNKLKLCIGRNHVGKADATMDMIIMHDDII